METPNQTSSIFPSDERIIESVRELRRNDDFQSMKNRLHEMFMLSLESECADNNSNRMEIIMFYRHLTDFFTSLEKN